MIRSALALALALALTACGGSTAPPPAKTAKVANDAPVAGDSKPVTALRRADVRGAIAQGLGVFLQNVSVDDYPVMQNGKFYGFKIKELNPDWIVDLRPGDVVTRINGVVPERPDDADNAFRSLEKATALKVDFEREGKPRTLELPIVD